jgi:hypothetical protein
MYNKYHAKKTEIDGIEFDSKAEANRYCELKLLQKANKISDLKLQVPFELVPKQKGERAVKYIADFVYLENGINIIEDCKGIKTPLYIVKRKLTKQLYPQYTFKESK